MNLKLLLLLSSLLFFLLQVVGLELVPQAVEDAKQNAKLNGIANAEFFAGRAEQTLRAALHAEAERNGGALGRVVGVVDPPRSGLHPDVVKALRKCEQLQHLVYVSCNPAGSLLDDAVALCEPVDEKSVNQRKRHGKPFRPTRAVPVDLFPHTDHCEMVVVFSRLDKRTHQPDRQLPSHGKKSKLEEGEEEEGEEDKNKEDKGDKQSGEKDGKQAEQTAK
jgi:tRNA (uracil-5-)-methyltransferase